MASKAPLGSKAALALALAIVVLAPVAAAQTIRLEGGVFKVEGWKPEAAPSATGSTQDWSSIFPVYAGGNESQAMIGSYAIEGGALVFRPRFPLAAGVRYRAIFQPPGGTPKEAWFDGPALPTTPAVHVLRVYPSEDVLPSNTLKLYIVFSASMSRGEAWKHIHMLDEDGKELEVPFLVIEQELWDPTYQRLTLLFDPGRIKRGLVLNETIGPPIVEGKQYTLVIDRGWLDASGVPMPEGFRKTFRGGPPDRTPPFVKNWRVTAPRAGTSDPLLVDFPKPMDYGLMQHLIEVQGVHGTVAVERDETRWRFTPDLPWKPGQYQLIADSLLEDLAGNHLDRPFDVDTAKTGQERFEETKIPLSFVVR